MITFAILAHNEAPTVGNVVSQAAEAARDGDRVVVVDSASTDRTAQAADEAGAEVIVGPLGKGAAMALAAERTATPWLCYLDADLVETEHNIPALLRQAACAAEADTVMIVGEFEDPPPPPILSNTVAVYTPLVAALFPEAAGRFGSRPLSGFRVLRPGIVGPDLPCDFGVESHLNLAVAASGKHFELTPIGLYQQRFRYKPDMGLEIAAAILDLAVAHGRLAVAARPAWQRWVDDVVSTVAGYTGEQSQREVYLAELRAVSSRPLPATGV